MCLARSLRALGKLCLRVFCCSLLFLKFCSQWAPDLPGFPALAGAECMKEGHCVSVIDNTPAPRFYLPVETCWCFVFRCLLTFPLHFHAELHPPSEQSQQSLPLYPHGPLPVHSPSQQGPKIGPAHSLYEELCS
jgi:hypothetical protein